MFSFTSTPLTSQTLWSLTYFAPFFYILLIFTAVLYLVGNIRDFVASNSSLNLVSFSYSPGWDFSFILFSPVLIWLILNGTWTHYILFVWFGHLTFSFLQAKLFYFLALFFSLVLLVYLSSFYFSSLQVYDYFIVLFSFFIWLFFFFYSTNLFSFMFFIEIISTLLILMLSTSTFSSLYFYNNTNFSVHLYFQQSLPFSFLQTLMFFFWVSLLGSLNLFLFLTFFYLKLLTFEWYLIEHVFQYFTTVASPKEFMYITISWANLLFCIFLKCGLAPFHFWKPLFFKGMPLHFLFFYVFFFYLFLFLFFSYFFLIFVSEVFYSNVFATLFFTLVGFFLIIFLFFESYYIKAFVALSSILNTLLLLLALTSFITSDLFFFL